MKRFNFDKKFLIPGMFATLLFVSCDSISNNSLTSTSENMKAAYSSSDLFFSEYVEGSSNNKALELYNSSGSTVDLSDYSVSLYANGNTSASYTENLSGSLASGDVFVIANSSASFASYSYVDLKSSVTSFNGNDVVVLYKNGELIDIIGQIGSSTTFAANQTLIRNSDINSGTTTYSSSEWTQQSSNYFDNLGSHTADNSDSGSGSSSSYPAPDGYYDSADGLTGSSLKSALNNIIDGHMELSYSSVYDALEVTDADPDNSSNVILLYTGVSRNGAAQYNSGAGWNREHVWAKSHGNFGTSAGAGTDLHHLRASDVSVNSARGNLEFDEGGTQHSEATGCYYDSDSWEPRDEVKGDVARMLFYMAVRYEGENGEVDLQMSEDINDSLYNPTHGKLSTLLKWHAEDPVSEEEEKRNHVIYNDYQGNRNPFIDNPEYANLIWE